MSNAAKLDWADFKALCSSRNLSMQWSKAKKNMYWVKAQDGPFRFDSVVRIALDEDGVEKTGAERNAEQIDFEDNYKNVTNKKITIDNPDGRQVVHTTPRKRGLFTCFLGVDDDQTNPSKVTGGSNVLAYHHAIGAPASHTIYFDLNTIANETMAHAGHMMWKDALLDRFSLHTVPKLSTYEAGVDTNYSLFGGYLIIPAAGNGTITPTNMVLVEVPLNEFGARSGAGYWDATYNTTTNAFEGITANVGGTGRFNMFAVEVVLDKFVEKMPLLGSGFMALDTYDASQIGHGMRIKMTIETIGADHDWYWCGALKPYRKKTV